MSEEVPPGKPIKLVVWNLDDARWSTVLVGEGALDPGVRALVEVLDERGILMSVVTRRPAAAVAARLVDLGLADYFLLPQLGTEAPAAAVGEIAGRLNLPLDATLVIGDADEVRRVHPQVRGVAHGDPGRLAEDPRMGRSLLGIEPRPRRLVYREEQARVEAERAFVGPKDAFVASLGMQLTLVPARVGDLHRVRELVTRTNQLGVSYSDDDLVKLVRSPRHACWLVSLVDRFGDCGQVGLVVVERVPGRWVLQLLQFSCRVLPRGVDTIVLHEVDRRAREEGAQLVAQARPTSKNEAMLAAYQRAGFAPCAEDHDVILLARAEAELPPVPPGVHVTFVGGAQASP